MPKSQNFSPFLRVAAILLLLLGAGWFSYVYWVEPRESSLATNVPVNTPPADPRITTESVPAQPTQPSSPAQVQQITPVQQAPAPLDTPERQRTEAVDNVKADEGLIAQAAQPKVVYESKNTEPTPTEDLIKDQVVANADPIPQEADKANNRQEVVLAQEAKAKSLKRSGSIQQLAENPEPADGWKAYEDYLNNNRDSRAVAPTASNTVTHTQVLLSFDIDKKGRPSKVRVEESGGTFYDDAAKKLLLNGPDWKMGKSGARGQLRVHF